MATRSGSGSVPCDGAILLRHADLRAPSFVSGYEMGQNGPECGMWAQVVDIVLGTRDNLPRTDGVVDVARFTVVVPCGCARRPVSHDVWEMLRLEALTRDDLDKFRPKLEHVHPPVIPELLARGEPVLFPLGQP